MKKTLLALSVAGLLSACGGSDNGSSTNTTDFKVIDGYLSNASVCVIPTGSEECTVLGKTGTGGVISIPEGTAGQLVATITAGETSDEDGVGFVGSTYQMIADISDDSSNVITPYTTLDALDDTKTIEQIAAELGLDVDVIKGDYVASMHEDRAKVHALARALTTQLSENKDDNTPSDLITKAETIKNYIEQNLVTTGTDLDSVNITLGSNGEAINVTAIKNLNDFLLNEAGFHVLSTNKVEEFEPDSGDLASFSNDGTFEVNDETGTYSTSGNILTTSFDSEAAESDEFIYVDNSMALVVPTENKNDLHIYIPNENSSIPSFSSENLIGQTYYLIFDDSDNGFPIPSFVQLSFSESKVKFIESGEQEQFDWSIDEDGSLTLKTSDTVGDKDMTLSGYAENGVISVYSTNHSYVVMLKDKNLATSIFGKWKII